MTRPFAEVSREAYFGRFRTHGCRSIKQFLEKATNQNCGLLVI